MFMNSLTPALGSKPKALRVGRGIGCTKGKTCGRGHKGQKARCGYARKSGFEGGQMPLQRRVPKFGFRSRKQLVSAEVRLDELNQINDNLLADGVVNLKVLKAANIINRHIKFAKIFSSGKLEKSLKFAGIKVTKGARAAIEKAGGSVD